MKKIFILLFCAAIVFLIAYAQYNNNPEYIISNLVKKGEIKDNELKYQVYVWWFIPIGEAVFKKEEVMEWEGKKVLHLQAIANISKFVAHFANAGATLDSYLDTTTLNPLLFKEKLVIPGKEDIVKEIRYDQKNNVMTLEGVKRQIMPNTQDPLSLVFNLRKMDLIKIKQIEINMNSKHKNYIFKANVDSDVLKVGKNTYKVLLVKGSISRRDNNPYHRSDINIIILDNKEKTPVLIKIFSGGAVVNAKLIETR